MASHLVAAILFGLFLINEILPKLGPTLNVFHSPDIASFIINNTNLIQVATPEEDLTAMMNKE